MLVWKAMPSITPMMSAILRLDAEIASMVCTTWPTAAPPCAAMSLAVPARRSASTAVAALLLTVELSCSIDAAVCCRLAACSSVRWLRSALPVAISCEPVAIDSELERTAPTMPRSECTIAPIDCISWPISSRASERTSRVRSPAAMAWASSWASRTGLTTERVSTAANHSPATSASAQPAPSAITPSPAAASAAALVAFMRWSW